MKELLSEIKFDTTIGSYSNRWEFFKYKVRQFSIKCGKQRSKDMQEQKSYLVQEIDKCCKRCGGNFSNAQSQLFSSEEIRGFYNNILQERTTQYKIKSCSDH